DRSVCGIGTAPPLLCGDDVTPSRSSCTDLTSDTSYRHVDLRRHSEVVRIRRLLADASAEPESDATRDRLEAVAIGPKPRRRVRARLGKRPPLAARVDLKLDELPAFGDRMSLKTTVEGHEVSVVHVMVIDA